MPPSPSSIPRCRASASGRRPAPTPRVGWGPILDGRIVTVRSFFEVAPEHFEERADADRLCQRRRQSDVLAPDRGGVACHPEPATLGDAKATALIAAMKKAHPEKSIRTLSYGVSGIGSAQQRAAHGRG